jgi:hypothetical protein
MNSKTGLTRARQLRRNHADLSLWPVTEVFTVVRTSKGKNRTEARLRELQQELAKTERLRVRYSTGPIRLCLESKLRDLRTEVRLVAR